MNTTQNSTKSKIVKVIGVDLAKDHCDVIGYDENGKICLRLDGLRASTKVERFFSQSGTIAAAHGTAYGP